MIEKSLKFLVLLIEQSGLLDEVLSFDQQGIIFRKSFIKGLPGAKFLLVKHCGHLLPEDTLLTLNPLLLLFLGLEVGALLHPGIAEKLRIVGAFLSLLVEVLEDTYNVIVVNHELIFITQLHRLHTFFKG